MELANDLRAGRFTVIGDDVRGGGYMLLLAERVDISKINFLITEARGLVAVALTADRCDSLELTPIPTRNAPGHEKDLMVGVEARVGVTTGISAADRTRTIAVLSDPGSASGDLCAPGHVVPLWADPDGVLGRPGIAEAAIDLARMTGSNPVVVVCDVLAEDGSHLAVGPDLSEFSAKRGLGMTTIRTIAEHRLETEQQPTFRRG